MSQLKRVLLEQVYLWERKQKKKQVKKTDSIIKMPQIVGFRVGEDTINQAPLPHSKSPVTRRGHRRRANEVLNQRKVIGSILIVIGCLMFLTKCFGAGEMEEVDTVEEVSFETYIEALEIPSEFIDKLIRGANKNHESYAYTSCMGI